MFGFLTAPCSGCSSKEHSVYRAHFCGLCNRLRQDYGLPARLLVNRDATFLSLLGNGLQETPKAPVSNTCCNPLGKPRLVVQEGEAVSYAAAVTLCGLKAKLDDEVDDRRAGPTRLTLQGLRGITAQSVTKAEQVLSGHDFPLEDVQAALSEQTDIEAHALRTGAVDLEVLTRPTAFAFGNIVAHTSSRARGSLEQIGQSLGRLIYTLDAFVDRARDQRRGQFNPFLLQPQLAGGLTGRFEGDLRVISGALGELPLFGHREVLDVILGRNLRNTCMSVVDAPDSTASSESERTKKKKNRNQDGCCGDCFSGWTWCDVVYCCDPSCCDASCCDAGCCDCDVCCCDCS